MNRQQNFRAAKQELERRRQRAETEAIERRAELLANAVGYAVLEQQQGQAGARAAALAAAGDGEAARVELARVHELAHEKLRVLKGLGIDPAVLEPRYTCALCKDTGKYAGKSCACLLAELRRLRREEINESGPLSLCRFESFSLNKYSGTAPDGTNVRNAMEGILQDCRYYTQEFGPKSESLFLYGDAGLGKTHLALSVASEVLEQGFDVIYVSAQSAFSAVSAARFESGGTVFASMLEADLLVLDDLGTEFIDAFVLSKLYELVNGRMRKPTVFTTNISRQDLLYQRYTEKIASRLLGECHLMRFYGDDIRLQRA